MRTTARKATRKTGILMESGYKELRTYTIGWLGYYRIALLKTLLSKLDPWIRHVSVVSSGNSGTACVYATKIIFDLERPSLTPGQRQIPAEVSGGRPAQPRFMRS
ncbi:MAG: group II intron maturase-specific domain-containing protein [Planctomycetia bacterium]|nr:group II intron maturase-specific domain-containing protein [Planctomycetia bacterium]